MNRRRRARHAPSRAPSSAAASIQSGGALPNSASTVSVPGNAVLHRVGCIERGELAVIDDRDAVAEFVGFVHVVRGQQNGHFGFVAQSRESFPTRWFAKQDRGRSWAHRETESWANGPGPARFPSAGACRPKRFPRARREISSGPPTRADRRSAGRGFARHSVELRVDQHIFSSRSVPDRM